LHTIISKSGIIATFLEKGAELVSLKTAVGKEYIWAGNPEFWGKHSPVLFPIVGTLKDNAYEFQNRTYPLSRHGFARDQSFSVVQKSGSSITFSLQESAETLAVYPFRFELQIKYTLENDTLEIQYQVSNKNTAALPFSLGAHPAFALSENFEDYSLEFETNDNLNYHLLDHDLISNDSLPLKLTNKQLPLTYQLFENDALVFKSVPAKKITILENGKPRVKVGFSDFPDLGIWTKINAPFLCIEPWFGYSDSASATGKILEKEGVKILNSGARFKAMFTIEVF